MEGDWRQLFQVGWWGNVGEGLSTYSQRRLSNTKILPCLVWWKSISGREYSKCKIPEAETSWENWRNEEFQSGKNAEMKRIEERDELERGWNCWALGFLILLVFLFVHEKGPYCITWAGSSDPATLTSQVAGTAGVSCQLNLCVSLCCPGLGLGSWYRVYILF